MNRQRDVAIIDSLSEHVAIGLLELLTERALEVFPDSDIDRTVPHDDAAAGFTHQGGKGRILWAFVVGSPPRVSDDADHDNHDDNGNRNPRGTSTLICASLLCSLFCEPFARFALVASALPASPLTAAALFLHYKRS
jgi:hypothetical protein